MGCIEVMDNVFIGANSIIMPNVRIGPNAIVAAGSVVTKDVGEGVIVAGVTARVIEKINDIYLKRAQESISQKKYSRQTENR
jgi:acetyltransferase-like isoleucine patch superfamily enzyme